MQVALLLKSGQLVAIPTETVYGLAADVMQEEAVAQIFSVKGRPADNPLIAHISSMEQLGRLVQNPSGQALQLARHFWPGPLTLLFERKGGVPSIVSAHLSTIAVRMPSHPCARQIIEAVGSPLAAPSANRSGLPSPTSAQDVLDDFADKISAVVDGGPCPIGIESTVVGWIDGQPTLFRPGAVSREAIENALGMKLGNPANGAKPHSPGMKYRHYAPRARLTLVDREVDKQMKDSQKIYVPESVTARNLFFHLRKADRLGYGEIVVVLNDRIRDDEALMNRLLCASSRL
jgi:L-threonylcarbamoyladenylate synthase